MLRSVGSGLPWVSPFAYVFIIACGSDIFACASIEERSASRFRLFRPNRYFLAIADFGHSRWVPIISKYENPN